MSLYFYLIVKERSRDCAQTLHRHHSLHWLWVCVWVRDAARLLRCKKVCFARLVARVVCEPAAPEAVWGG